MPSCWIIAGSNGAGKTTFALQYLPEVAHCRRFINADLIAAGLALPSMAMSKMRMAERVAHGGHNIPAADIERRFARRLHNLLNAFSPVVDGGRCFMNHTSEPTLVFEQKLTQRTVIHTLFFELLEKESQS